MNKEKLSEVKERLQDVQQIITDLNTGTKWIPSAFLHSLICN
jgi:hypothetical protein